MDFLGRLFVQIVGDNSQLDRSIDQSRRRLNAFSRVIQQIGRRISALLNEPLDEAAESTEALGDQAEDTSQQLSLAFDEMQRDVADASREITNDLQDVEEALEDVEDETDDTTDSVQTLSQRLRSFSDGAVRVGQSLTTRVTLPITLAAGAAARLAIQAQETNSAFRTSFRGIEDAADSAAQNLQDNFGLSRLESERLLQSTGDLLRGFGATQTEALGLSSQVQELAVDLASFRNIQGGAERASEALTAALLGETDQLRSLGIVIRQADVDQRILENGQAELTGQARLLARAQATLEIAYQQSGDAVGDFARTSDSTANQIRQLRSDITDAAVEIGENLLPVVNDVLSVLRDATSQFANFNERQQNLVITLAAIAAGAGPAILAIGRLGQAVAFLASNPVVLGAAISIAGLTFAVQQLTQASRESRDSVEDLSEALGLTTREVDRVAQALGEAEQFDRTFEDIERSVRGIADASGRTVEEVIQIGIQSSRVGDEYREQLSLLQQQVLEQQAFNDVFTRSTGLAEQQSLQARAIAARQAEVNRVLAEEEAARARIQGVLDSQIELNEALRAIDRAIRSGILTEEQALQRKLDIRTEELERLREQGIANEVLLEQGQISVNEANRVRDAINAAIDSQEQRSIAYTQRLAQLNTQIVQAEIVTSSQVQEIFDERISQQEEEYLSYAGAVQQAIDRQRAQVEAAAQAEAEARRVALQRTLSDYQQVFSQIGSIVSALTARENVEASNREQRDRDLLDERLANLEEEEERRIAAIEDESERETALADLQDRLDDERAEAEAEIDRRRRELQRRQARRQKVLSLFDIGINTASAVAEALPNIPLSIAVGILGTAQGAIVASTPLPALAEGGFFSGPALIGEAGREFAFPIDGPQGQSAMSLMADRIVDSMNRGSASTTNNQNITMNSMFALGDESSRRRAARLLYPALEDEARRRGARLGA